MTGDRLLGFTLPRRDVRGQLVRLDGVASAILSAHALEPDGARLLAEALALTALVGGLARLEEGQITLQAQGRGGRYRLLVADWRSGELRGHVEPAGDGAPRSGVPGAPVGLAGLLGEGHLALTLDETRAAERYQGIVPLEGPSLAAAAETYFTASEQLPTSVILAARPAGGGWSAGGLLVQHLARREQGGERLNLDAGAKGWDHVRALAATATADELVDPGLTLETLLWRLFHEEDEVRLTADIPLVRGCRCTRERLERVLATFGEADRQHMADEAGFIHMDCVFCARRFSLPTSPA